MTDNLEQEQATPSAPVGGTPTGVDNKNKKKPNDACLLWVTVAVLVAFVGIAVIAILAAIAVPNFLEAQVRAKVARTRNDMRSLTTGLEAYMVDNDCYPAKLERLTTPVEYMYQLPIDPFSDNKSFLGYVNLTDDDLCGRLAKAGLTQDQIDKSKKIDWLLIGAGPDRKYFFYDSNDASLTQSINIDKLKEAILTLIGEPGADLGFIYDATNGTVSGGDLVRGIGNWNVIENLHRAAEKTSNPVQ